MIEHAERILSALNPAQRKAATTIEGPLMIIAGPGTGKTHVLAHRVGYLLASSDVAAHNVLLFSYTEAAAATLRARLVDLLGTVGYQVHSYTFHSFASFVFSRYREYFDDFADFQPITKIERHGVVAKVVSQLHLEYTSMAMTTYRNPYREFLEKISLLQQEGQSPADFSRIVEEEVASLHEGSDKEVRRRVGRWQELAEFYTLYQNAIFSIGRYEFDDMIPALLKAMDQHDALRLQLQEQFQYIAVDEYQDTNSIQNQLVFELASYWGPRANLCVVGDPNQSIFRFQGASVANMSAFLERFPEAALVKLTTGYRCPQPVYDRAQALVAVDHAAIPASLKKALSTGIDSSNERAGGLQVARGSDLDHLIAWTVAEVKKELQAGRAASDIALLARYHKELEPFAQALTVAGIPVASRKGANALSDQWVKLALDCLQAVLELPNASDHQLYQLLIAPWSMVSLEVVVRLHQTARQQHRPLSEIIFADQSEIQKLCSSLDRTMLDRFVVYRTVLLRAHQDSWSLQPTAWFATALETIGVSSALESPDGLSHLPALRALLQELSLLHNQPQFSTATELLQALRDVQKQSGMISSSPIGLIADQVELSTIHSARGREWQRVFLVSGADSSWGEKKSKDLWPSAMTLDNRESDEAEMRRLWYVSITRAKSIVTLLVPAYELSASNKIQSAQPVRFFPELLSEPGKSSWELAEISDSQTQHVAPKTWLPWTDSQRNDVATIVRERFFDQEFALSASSFRDWLIDPELFIRRHLLGIPEAPQQQLAAGQALHAVLEQWNRARLNQRPLSLSTVHQALELELTKRNVEKSSLRKDIQDTKAFFSHHYQSLLEQPSPVAVELSLGSRSTLVFEGIRLKGKLDLVELVPEVAGAVRIVDYKYSDVTKAKVHGLGGDATERERAIPKAIQGRLFHQLCFYRMLYGLDATRPYKVVHSTSFVSLKSSNKGFPKLDVYIDQDQLRAFGELLVEEWKKMTAYITDYAS